LRKQGRPDGHDCQSARPVCPLCGGNLELLRDLCRCLQCNYSVCDSCDAGTIMNDPHRPEEPQLDASTRAM